MILPASAPGSMTTQSGAVPESGRGYIQQFVAISPTVIWAMVFSCMEE
jgi:hypothetical protein